MNFLTTSKKDGTINIGIAFAGFVAGAIITTIATVALSVWAQQFAELTQSEILSITQARFVRDALRQEESLVIDRNACKPFAPESGDHRDGIAWRYRCSGVIPESQVQAVFWYALSAQGSVIYYEKGIWVSP